jgi:hypothetical protein
MELALVATTDESDPFAHKLKQAVNKKPIKSQVAVELAKSIFIPINRPMLIDRMDCCKENIVPR